MAALRRYTTQETVELSPLPCWKHLSEETYQKRVAGLVDEIEEEAAEERRRTDKPVLGVAAILGEDPQYRPACLDRSPATLFLVASYSMWRTLYDAYAWSVLEFRSAAEKLHAGDRDAPFPCGSFPPALPFVGG